MNQLLRHLGGAGLRVYLSGWMAIAPGLLLCVCEQGHAAVTYQAHEAPACGQHDHGEVPDQQDSPEHEVQQVLHDEVLPRLSDDTLVAPQAVLIGVIDFDASSYTAHGGRESAMRPHGPPPEVRASIASTVLIL